MTTRLVKRIAKGLRDLDRDDRDPLAAVDSARRLREAADGLELSLVEQARDAGYTWKDIGALYGLTKQGAQQRFRRGDQGSDHRLSTAAHKSA